LKVAKIVNGCNICGLRVCVGLQIDLSSKWYTAVTLLDFSILNELPSVYILPIYLLNCCRVHDKILTFALQPVYCNNYLIYLNLA
jgi:hypothetical protein